MSLLTSFVGNGSGLLGNFFGGGIAGNNVIGTSSQPSGGLASRVLTSPAFWMAGALVVIVLVK